MTPTLEQIEMLKACQDALEATSRRYQKVIDSMQEAACDDCSVALALAVMKGLA